MKHSRFALIGVLLAASLFGANAGELKVGDKAPGFELASPPTAAPTSSVTGPSCWPGSRRPTPGAAPIECESLAENGHLIEEFEVDYFMVSCDSIDDNKGFAEAKHNADFPMLSDPTKETAKAFGVLNPRAGACPTGTTFYIGPDGTILAIDRKVNPATAAEDIAAKLAELDVPQACPRKTADDRQARA